VRSTTALGPSPELAYLTLTTWFSGFAFAARVSDFGTGGEGQAAVESERKMLYQRQAEVIGAGPILGGVADG